MNIAKTIYNFFLDIFFPKRCVSCGEHGSFLCFECTKTIEYLKTPTCLRCGKMTKWGEFCPTCRKQFNLSGIVCASTYDCSAIKELIHNFKYNNVIELDELLAEVLSEKVKKLPLPKDTVLVPVPLYRKKEAARGYNQSELIARKLSPKLKFVGSCALARVCDTHTQVGLNKNQRTRNVSGAFKCIDAEFIKGKTVVLIDDVVTTGSTLNECASVLMDAGAKKVIGATVAKRM